MLERRQAQRQAAEMSQQAEARPVTADQENPPEEQAEGSVRPEVPLQSNTATMGPPRTTQAGEASYHWITQFCKLKPPAFRGKIDTQVAEEWLQRLDKIFEVLECPEDRKAQLAIYKLEGDADRWWRSVATTLKTRCIPVTWEIFLEKFHEQYFPRSVQVAKESEFLSICQGQDESFDDYLARFTSLSQYSSYLKRFDDEKWKANMLVRGLKYEIREKLVSQEFKKLGEAIETCRTIERNLKELRVSRGNNAPASGGSSRGNSSLKRKAPWHKPQGVNKRPMQSGQQGYTRQSDSRPCFTCKKYHPGADCEGKWVCYKCHNPGHISRECPQNAPN